MSNGWVSDKLVRVLRLAVAVAAGSCEQGSKSAQQDLATPPVTGRVPPACHIDAPSACRVGCDAVVPKPLIKVAPDLSGLDTTGLNGVEIIEILIDVRGSVGNACLLRGVREDVDDRAIAAIRQWLFEPARLRRSTPPGLAVPIVITVTLQIGRAVMAPRVGGLPF